MEAVLQLISELQCQVIDKTSAFCEVDGCLVKVTLLSDDPVSILLAFFVGANPPQTALQLQSIPLADKTEVSVDEGFLWLSLFTLHETTGPALAQSVRGIVAQLKQQGFEFDTRCGVCGARDTPATLQNGQPMRICNGCVESQQRRTKELNQFKMSQLLYLPLGMLGVAIGWTVLWTLMDFFLEWMNAGRAELVMEINHFTIVLLLAIGLALCFLGTVMGKSMRFARSSRVLAIVLSVIVTVVATMLGEIIYIWCALFRIIGFVDFEAAERLLLPWLQSYHTTWLVIRLLGMACAFGGCVMSTRETVVAPLMEAKPK